MGLLEALIGQAKNPKGFVGSAMLKIMNSAHSRMTAWGLSKIHIDDHATVLDIGCGGGQTLKTLSSILPNGRIYGVDYSEEAVAASIRENSKDVQAGKMAVMQAGVSSMPFQDGHFDLATAFQTHYFWPDLKNDIREVNRILKPGGRFLLVSEIYKINYHMKEYKTADALRALFVEAGFTDVQVFQSKAAVCFVGTK